MKKVISLLAAMTLALSSIPAVFAQSYCAPWTGYGYSVACSAVTSSNPWGWWGWWGSSSLQRDYCPDGDNTFSYYDGMCDNGVAAAEAEETTTTTEDDSGEETTTTTTVVPVEGGGEEVVTTVVTTTTTTEGEPVEETVVTTTVVEPTVDAEEVNTILSIKDQLMMNNTNSGSTWGSSAWGNADFNLPSFLPQTGAAL